MFAIEELTKSFPVQSGRHYVFRNVSFEIPAGVNVGILGPNGAGKSTLLRILGGIDHPDSGEIRTSSTVSWPLGLKGGFVGHLTGRENCRMVCRLYGLQRDQISEMLEQVKEQSGIGEYFEEPVKTYSSGMGGRLGFALSMAFDFDYYLIDEVTSVGDARFKKMAKRALEEKVATSRVILVSHSMATIREFCDIGIYLEDGKVQVYEDLEDAIAAYQEFDHRIQFPSPEPNVFETDQNVPENLQKAFQLIVGRIHSIEQKLQNDSIEIQGLAEVFYARLGNLMEIAGDRKRSIQYHCKALEIEPGHAPSITKLMLLSEQEKKMEDAVKWATQLFELQPNSPHLAMFRVRRLIEEGKDAEALDQLNNIIARHPDLPGPFLEKSKVLEDLDDLETALEIQEMAVQKFPQHPGLKKRLSQLLSSKGDLHRAMLSSWLAEPTPVHTEKIEHLADQLGDLDDRLSR